MKSKKLISVLLTLAMVISMFATFSITASAGKLPTWVKVEKYGKTLWYRTDKVRYNDNENDEAWECDCWNLIVGKFAYDKGDEYWYDEYPCEHLVEYEPLTNLVMKYIPTKTKYTVGDKIDLTGGMMTATTISEKNEDVNITSSMISGFDSTTIGTKNVIVTYRGRTTGFTVTVEPKDLCNLDLETSTTDITEKKELEQYYNLDVKDGTKSDVTKVKLSWEIKDLNATRTDNMVWDTENLCWKTDSSSIVINQVGSAKFTLENYSSVKVNAEVTFDTAEYATGKKFTTPTLTFDEDNNENTKDDGKVIIGTANGNTTYSKENVPNKIINVEITANNDDFKTLSATTTAKKYGTYTVKISKFVDVCSHASVASAYTAKKNSTHIYADEETLYNENEGYYDCNPLFFIYNEATAKFECTGSDPHYSLETEFADVTTIGWYYFNGTKFVKCADDENHPNDEEVPTKNAK